MSDTARKIAGLVGIAALGFATFGIGLAVFGAGASIGGALGISSGVFGLSLGTLASIGTIGLSVASTPSIESTGSNVRGQPIVDEGAMGAYVFGKTSVPRSIVDEESNGSLRGAVRHDLAPTRPQAFTALSHFRR